MDDLFTQKVWQYYKQSKRDLPWRNIQREPVKDRGYKVVVSEFMLQQTQVGRVIEKYKQWLRKWPTIETASRASLADFIVEWNGLGYNRRAKYLYDSLQEICRTHHGIVPSTVDVLEALPGIGTNTAAAIVVYTYNQPLVFVETNIRSVFLYEYYRTQQNRITDEQIRADVKRTLDMQNPREWYYALMDYGTYVKKTQGNQLVRATAYKKQPRFTGSNRQIRGKVLRILSQVTQMSYADLCNEISDDRLPKVLHNLVEEGLITFVSEEWYTLPSS